MLATGVHSYPSVYHLFSFYIQVIVKLHQTIHKVQIYFVFLSVGSPKTDLKGGYWAGMAEALLQAFGLSFGSCGLANVLTTAIWL